MASMVWNRTSQDAYERPYEYDCEKQFISEADLLLKAMSESLIAFNMTFDSRNRSATKAIWMLTLDAVDTLRECWSALQLGKHRVVAKLFRNVIESLDLAEYFRGGDTECSIALSRWYNNKEVKHGDYRKWLEKTQGKVAADASRETYFDLSQFTHNNYTALLDGYTLGANDMMIHDSETECRLLVPRQTISVYYVVLAKLTLRAKTCALASKACDIARISEKWIAILQETPVPPRFMSRSELMPEIAK
jgi:hypothetical protein